MYNTSGLQAKKANGELILGTHVFTGAPSLTEAIAMCGFDVIWIDTEHTAIGLDELQNNLIAARAGGSPAFVRVRAIEEALIKPVIDMGCDGIIFPNVKTADEARKAIAFCNYPPEGTRGYGPLRALDYGLSDQIDYIEQINKKMWRIIQIENKDAVVNIEEILDVEGADAYIIGPNDLSASCGYRGQPAHPDMDEVYDKLSSIIIKRKKLLGVSAGFIPAQLEPWYRRGARLIFAGSDTSHVVNGTRAVLAGLKGLFPVK